VGLEAERHVFDSHLQEWLASGHEGKWVAILHEEAICFFDSLDEAYRAGVERWGTDQDFLAKQVRAHTDIATIQRVFWSPRHEQKEAG